MLALGQAGFCASGINFFVDHLGVTQGGNDFLLHQNLITGGTVLALGQAGCSTGCSNCLVNDFCMTQRCNNFLSYQNFIADRTMLALGQSRIFARGINSCVDDFCVTKKSGNKLFIPFIITATDFYGICLIGASSWLAVCIPMVGEIYNTIVDVGCVNIYSSEIIPLGLCAIIVNIHQLVTIPKCIKGNFCNAIRDNNGCQTTTSIECTTNGCNAVWNCYAD